MKRAGFRPNRNRQQGALSVSLFPFLAVLICTMGALILLLVVIARQARLQAAQAAVSETADEQKDLQADREMVRWRIEQLQNSREKTESQLAESRLALGHVEDHARRLRDQLARLQATYNDLGQLGGDGRQRNQLEAELARLRADLANAERRLAETRQAAQQRRRSYAVVPYRGPRETRRQPIYIECNARTITLQPEGIVLTEEDFDGPMGPGNPLAAALRAAREHLLAQGDFDPEKSGEPYPLLLIRPDGIEAYYAARAAMESWASEFGYELIGEDWKLQFRPPDDQLAQVVRRAVDTARVRQRRLAAAAPRHYGNPQRAKYRVSSGRGGVVLDSGSSGGGQPGFQRRESSGGFGGNDPPAGGSQPDRTVPPQATSNEATAPQGTVAGRPPSEPPPSPSGQGGAAMRPGEWRPSQTSAADRPPAGQRGGQAASLAASRGRDWALPDATQDSVPITRPIRIECHADRLVIVPEQGLSGGKSILLAPRTGDSIDEFVSGVWEHMDSWGIAGNGMYWRPILNVYVAPDAQGRFSELQTLLEESGLTLKRKQ